MLKFNVHCIFSPHFYEHYISYCIKSIIYQKIFMEKYDPSRKPPQLLKGNIYSNVYLEWKEIYNLPFKVLKDTKSREFQYKIS